ncbi:MAG: LysM peptidoglycan-binding domain-containing protein [Campylobacteraceae bacterium]|nr:LysM peptidoglycan-binding domain-containing protein [Campylobacteraceae bacterium]
MVGRALLFISLTCSMLFGYLITENNFAQQERVLKSLDINTSFLKDPILLSMSDDVNLYRTKHFLSILDRGYIFAPALRQMIAEASIPEAFLYLAMAESNFSARAYSKARAVGLWQFMPYTAKKFGLKIDEYVDERRDPVKSTKAAIKYLEYLHKDFEKWYLAAMAYNCGEGRVRRAIKQAGTDDLAVLIDPVKKYVPLETRNYIRKIITMAHLSGSADFLLSHDGEYLLNQGSSFGFEPVTVPAGTTLESVAKSVGLPVSVIKEYNVHLNYFFTPPVEYEIYIPYDKKAEFAKNFKPEKNASGFYVYHVKKGDSLYEIGKKYGLNYKIIKDYNSLKSNTLKIGQKLIIPSAKAGNRHYIIQQGDTLGAISRKFNVSLQALMQANELKNTNIYPGNKIVIP